MIERFTWKNGTAENPVPLTAAMIDKLISKGNQLGENMQVSGYYTGSDGISVAKSRVWNLEQLFPNLVFLGTQSDDNFSISVATSSISEGGQPIEILVSGIRSIYLKYKVLFDSITIDPNSSSLITQEEIQNRITVQVTNNTAYLVVDAPSENATWSANVRVKACPVYEDMETTTNYRTTDVDIDGNPRPAGVGVIFCSAVALTGVRISANVVMGTNTYNPVTKTPVPANSTKLGETTYSFTVNPAPGSSATAEYVPVYEAIHAGDTTGNIVVSCWPHLFGDSLPVSNELVITIGSSTVVTIKIDQNISDPASMVLNPSDTGYNNNQSSSNVISYIRQHSHCYVGKYYGESEGMKIKQLWDLDRRYYYDSNGILGQGALAPIDGTPDGNGIIADVFLRLPEFYYKTVNELDSNNQETGIVAISFATSEIDEDYIRWDPNTLIGVYEGTVINDGTSDKLYSISGRTPTGNYSQDNFKAAARRRNDQTAAVQSNHFSIINYQAHTVMALLYYCYWGGQTLNCQEIIGKGTSEIKNTGQTDALGMSETTAANNGNTGSINFWGLENWWGNMSEWMDDLISANNGIINVLNYDGLTIRQINCPVTTSGGCISQFVFGQYADMIPKAYEDTNYSLHFCDYALIGNNFGYKAYRSGYYALTTGGVGAIMVNNSGGSYLQIGSRLLYSGSVTEVDSF